MGTVGIGLLSFFAASALLLIAVQDYVAQRRRIYRTLRNVRAIEASPVDIRRRQLAVPISRRIIIPALKGMGHFVRRLTPAHSVDRLSRELIYAGSPAGWDAERVLAFKIIGSGVIGAGVFLMSALGGATVARVMTLTVLALAGGYHLPEILLRSRAQKRQELIQRALPDSLDLLSITVEAGLGFDAAVSRVARNVGGPLGGELHRLVREMQLGKTRVDALRDLAERSSVPELKSFVLAMIQADIFGVSVGKVLHVQANEMRVKRRQRAEERAQKIPVKIIFPLIFGIFPALFVVLLGPAVIRIYQSLFVAF